MQPRRREIEREDELPTDVERTSSVSWQQRIKRRAHAPRWYPVGCETNTSSRCYTPAAATTGGSVWLASWCVISVLQL
jgi:hypothetical protein